MGGGGKSTFPPDDLTIWGPWSERERSQGHAKAIPRQGLHHAEQPAASPRESTSPSGQDTGLPISKDWFHNNPQHGDPGWYNCATDGGESLMWRNLLGCKYKGKSDFQAGKLSMYPWEL